MSIYANAGHCISRIMSIEANDGTAKSPWQRKYQAGFEEPKSSSCRGDELTAEERIAQDAIARRIVHRVLSAEQWNALVAKYSINEQEVAEAVRWLIPRVSTKAHQLFRTKCVTAWAIPRKAGVRAGAKTSRRGLVDAFYDISTWDSSGIPERTLRNWRTVMTKWLEDQVTAGHKSVEVILKEAGLLIEEAA